MVRPWAFLFHVKGLSMAGSVNKAVLIGRLGADPEIRSLSNGKRVMNFRLATSESWKDRDGERQERTEWHNVSLFNDKLVDVMERFLKKGSMIYVEGKIQTRKYTDKNDIERYTTEIMVGVGGEITLLDSRKDSGSSDSDRDSRDNRDSDASRRGSSRSGGGNGRRRDDLDDDIPF